MKQDKIFNNRFNTGELEFEFFGKIQAINLDGDQDLFEELNSGDTQEMLYQIFKESPYFEDYSKFKKIPKGEMREIFYYFESKLPKTKEISMLDKFILIAEFMSFEYVKLYQELGVAYKENLLKDLDRKFQIFKKKKIHRLF